MQSPMVTKAANYQLDYYYAIARGFVPLPPLADGTEQFSNSAVPGAMPFNGIGERVTAGPVVNGMIWPNGAVYVPPIAGVQPSIASSSINDTAAGTGIRTVDVHYLDGSLTPKVEAITLNGVTLVPMVATDVRWIQKLHARTVGSGGGAAGNITAAFGANTLQYLQLGDVKSRSSMLRVPRDKVAFVHDAIGGAVSGTAAAQVHIELVATEEDEHQFAEQGLFFPKAEIAFQDSTAGFPMHFLKFKEGTIIGMTFTCDKAVLVTGTWFGWVEDV